MKDPALIFDIIGIIWGTSLILIGAALITLAVLS